MPIKLCSNHDHTPLPVYPLITHGYEKVIENGKEKTRRVHSLRPGREVKSQDGRARYVMHRAGNLIRVPEGE